MKKVIIGIVVAVLILGIGTGGALFWGYSNAKTDKTYSQKASTLVNDYQKKYSDNYLENKLKEVTTDEGKALTMKESLAQAKTDAQNNLNELNATKSSSRVTAVKTDAEDYFNITIASLDKMTTYIDYMKNLANVSNDLNAISNMGGEASSLEGAAAQFDNAKAGVDKAIKELDTASVPEGLKDFNATFKKDLTEMSQVLGGMAGALRAGDMALLSNYTTQLDTISKAMASIESPTDLSKKMISTDDQKKLDEIPSRLSTDANTFGKKIFAF